MGHCHPPEVCDSLAERGTVFDLTVTFTPTGGGAPAVEPETSAKRHEPKNVATCQLPAPLNTVTFPEGTVTVDGTVTGFFTPAE
jgi:hypothetical protein